MYLTGMLTDIDFLVVVLYLLALLYIGYRTSLKAAPESFLIADRRLNLLSAVATINASKTGSIVIIFTAFIYAYGISAVWYFIGMSSGYLLFLPFALKLHRASKKRYYTLADYFHFNYGERAAKFASLICIIVMFISMLLNLIAATKVFVFFSGYQYYLAAIIVAGVVLVYLLCAGFKAVVSTDLFQYIAIVVILLLFFSLLFSGSGVDPHDWQMFRAGTQTIAGFFLLGILIPFAQPELWQRVYAIGSERLLKQSILISIVIHMCVAVGLALIGLSIKTALPSIDPDLALIEGLARLLPTGLTGLVVVVLFSAMMSSIDTYAYTAASCVVQDFFRSLESACAVFWIRIVLVVVLSLGTVVNILYNNLIGAAFILSGYLVLISLPTLVTWIRPGIKPAVINLALPLSFLLMSAMVVMDITGAGLGPPIILKSIGIAVVCTVVAVIFENLKAKLRSPYKG